MSSHSSCQLSPSSDQQSHCHKTERSFTDTLGQQHKALHLELVLSHPTATLTPHSTTPWPLDDSDPWQKHLPVQTRLSAEHLVLWAATGSQNSSQAMPGYHNMDSVPFLARPDTWLGSFIGTVELWDGYVVLMAPSFSREQLPSLFQD